MKMPRSTDEASSATAFFHGLPVSVWTMVPKSCSRQRSSGPGRPMIGPRLVGGPAHAPPALRAPGADVNRVGHFRRASLGHLRDDSIVDRAALLECLPLRRD